MNPSSPDETVAVLNCPMEPNDSGAETVGGYLAALLVAVWTENEGFSGKRPFGNSGWECDVYVALIKAGLVEGSIDEDGYFEDCDEEAADRLIINAIGHAYSGGNAETSRVEDS